MDKLFSWSALIAHKCKTTSKNVTIVNGSGGLIHGKCDEPCDHHECRYNPARPEVPLPTTPPKTAPIEIDTPPTRVTRKPRAATPPEPKTPPLPAIREEKPKKCKVKPPKEENPYDHYKCVPQRSEDLPIIEDLVSCPKENTLVSVQSCRSGCGSYISVIRHSGTKEPHVRCASAKRGKIMVKEGVLA